VPKRREAGGKMENGRRRCKKMKPCSWATCGTRPVSRCLPVREVWRKEALEEAGAVEWGLKGTRLGEQEAEENI